MSDNIPISGQSRKDELDQLTRGGSVSKLKERINNNERQKSVEEEVTVRPKVERTRSFNPFANESPTPKLRTSLIGRQTSDVSTEACAVQLYKYQNGKYYLDMKIMDQVFGEVKDKLISIYSISGKYRSGKSFILSIFLKYLKYGHREDWLDFPFSESFKYKNCDQRVTTGIWIWSEPIIKKTEDGKDVAVFLMDTQGWHDQLTNTQESALVFSLSSMMSSVMLYNLERRIGEDDLHYFQCFSSQAKLMDEKNNDKAFQKLIFLIRDWQFTNDFDYGFYDDNTCIGGKNFKTDRIDPNFRQSLDASSVREIIRNSYQDISAYLMPYPGEGIQSDNFWSCNLVPTFVEHLSKFTELLFKEKAIIPKRIGGKLITGRELISFAQGWTKEFKHEPNVIYEAFKGIPAMVSSSGQNEEANYQMAFQTSIDYFDEMILKRLSKCQTVKDFQDVLERQREILLQSQAIFVANNKLKISKNEALKRKFAKKLQGELEERQHNYKLVIDHEIELKKDEEVRMAKEKELEDLMRANQYEDEEEENKYGEMRAEIKKLVKIEEEKKQIIRETKYDFQQLRRNRRKNWFQRLIGGIFKSKQKEKNEQGGVQKLIELESD